MKKSSYISKNVIRRLPRYLRKLDELTKAGVERISSGELGSQMGLTPSQIRQDFSCFGEFGQQGYGYNVAGLRGEIARILGMDRSYSVILIGAGRIGHVRRGVLQVAPEGVLGQRGLEVLRARDLHVGDVDVGVVGPQGIDLDLDVAVGIAADRCAGARGARCSGNDLRNVCRRT